MARRKADVDIGYRAAAEVRRLFDSRTKAYQLIGCNPKTVDQWQEGLAPSAIYLSRLHELGADVIWILTGKKGH